MRTKQLLRRSGEVLKYQSSAEVSKETKRVLCVAGAGLDLQFIDQQIKTLGFELILAKSHKEALALARYWKPSVIIAEITSNNLDGFKLFRFLKEDARTNSIPFLFISDKDCKPDQHLGFQAGADDYVMRPVEPKEFKSRLQSLIRRSSCNGASDFKKPASVQPAMADGGNTPKAFELENVLPEDFAQSQTDVNEETPGTHFENDGSALYKKSAAMLTEIFARTRISQRVNLSLIFTMAEEIVQSLEKSNGLFLRALHQKSENSLIIDSLNTTIYAVLVGKGLKYSFKQLVEIAVAGLINDIGFAKLPEDYLAPGYELSARDLDLVREHPIFGAQTVKKSLPADSNADSSWLTKTILQIHEREGGIGYPMGLRGDAICEYAKVIGIADTFESLLWEQTYKKGSVTYQALQKIIGLDKSYFPQKIKKALVTQISIFPVGTYVKLNSEEIGVITQTNQAHPMRPVIELIYDSKGVPLANREQRDLVEAPFLFITQVLSPDELQPKDRRDQTLLS
ncbi:MAG: HD domain-containing phosphohydrolase [bacterium]